MVMRFSICCGVRLANPKGITVADAGVDATDGRESGKWPTAKLVEEFHT